MSVQYAETGIARGSGGRWLRGFLKLDALASGALGALLAAASVPLTDLLGAPLALLVPVGVFLVGYAAGLWYLATRRQVSRTGVWTVIVVNELWAVASVALLLTGWISFTALGVGFVLLQAGAVLGFAAGQYLGLRRVPVG